MNLIKKLLEFMKNTKNELQIIKLMVLIIVNTWLLIIFWKILITENVNIVGNNIALTKMQTWLGPLLQILGLEVLSPNTIKMLLVTIIVLGVNITILHFNTVVLMVIPLGLARYGYKMYTNYLINSENMAKLSTETLKETLKTEVITPKVVEQAPIVINTGSASGTNWWLWGTVIVVGAVAVGAVIFAIWSHNTNANNMLSINDTVQKLNQNTQETLREIDIKTTRVGQYMDQLNSANTRNINSVNTKVDLVNQKVSNLETGYQEFGVKIIKLEEYNIENVKLLSAETLAISKEAKEFFGNVLQSNTATEALVVSIAKIVDGFDLVYERMTTIETRLDSMTGSVTTPRSSMFRTPNPSRFSSTTNININE